MYESLWGNTEAIARAIAQGLGDNTEVVDVANSPTITDDIDLIVAGGPTHAFSMTRENTREGAMQQGATQGSTKLGLREWMNALPSHRPHQRIATFDTRVDKVRMLPGSAARAAAKVARKRGYEQLGHSESFYVNDVGGPLLEGEVERARTWGNLLGRLASASG